MLRNIFLKHLIKNVMLDTVWLEVDFVLQPNHSSLLTCHGISYKCKSKQFLNSKQNPHNEEMLFCLQYIKSIVRFDRFDSKLECAEVKPMKKPGARLEVIGVCGHGVVQE